MNLEQYLLGRVAEEAAEVTKAALKAQNFGLHEKYVSDKQTNIEALIEETNDLLGVLSLLSLATGDDFSFVGHDMALKRKARKVMNWIHVPMESGRVVLTDHDKIVIQKLIDYGNSTELTD